MNLAERVLALLADWEAGRIDEHEVLAQSDGLLAEAVAQAETAGALDQGVLREDRFESSLVRILDGLSILYFMGVQARDVRLFDPGS